MSATVWHDALPLAALAPGQFHAVTLGEHAIVLGGTRDGCVALDDLCTHAEARTSEGFLRGGRRVCPLHGGAYDVRTGGALAPPCVLPPVTYPVRTVDRRLEVGVPG